MKVGIDLGTTYSTVSKYDKKTSRPEIINNKFEKELTPSVICFLDNGEILIGEDAKDMQAGGAGTIAASFKRGMGDNSFTVEANGKVYTAEELSAMLLKKLISDAEDKSGEKIDSVVITVPAYFNDFQRTATIRAGEACGVKVLKIINEPTAAAISYGYNRETNKTVLVYDLGGGTFDVTLVRVEKGNIRVIGTDGNHILGGKDWDAAITKYVCEQFVEDYGVDPRDDEPTKNELIVASENYKKVLTKTDSVTVQVKYDGYASKYVITRDQFDMRTQFLLNATKDVCMKLLSDLGTSWDEIDEILLVGGSTRMPQVKKFLEMVSRRPVIDHADTDLAVAKGAAITSELYCSTSTGLREMQITDVTAHSLGALAESPNGDRYVNEIMIRRNSKVPSSVRKPFKVEYGTPEIDIYTLQGESKIPLDCYVLARVVITGFTTQNGGSVIDVEYNYDENGVVRVSAFQGGEPLLVESQPVPDDISWMGDSPKNTTFNMPTSKNVVLCIDLSRSMRDSLEEVKSAVKDFMTATSSEENMMFGLVGFGDKVGVIRDMTTDPNTVITALEGLKVNVYGRGTDASPFSTAAMMMSNRPGGKLIVVLTDGIWGKRDFAVGEALNCKNSNIAVVGVGIGKADIGFLKQIATVEEGAIYTALNHLGETFSRIAKAINTGSMGLRESAANAARLGNAGAKGNLR